MLDVVRHPTHLVRTLVRRALVKPAQFRWGGERQGERGDVSGREDGTIRNVEEKKKLHPDLDFFANGHNTMSVEEVSAG